MTLNIQHKTNGADHRAAVEDPIAEIRRLHANVLSQRTQVFAISGYDDRLHVRYKVLDPDRKREILNVPGETVEQGHAQLLIEACDDILYRYQDGEIRPFPQGRVGYRLDLANGVEATLADVMGWDDIRSAAQIVLRMFGDKPEVMNIHAISVDRWMRTLFDEADASAVGGPPVIR